MKAPHIYTPAEYDMPDGSVQSGWISDDETELEVHVCGRWIYDGSGRYAKVDHVFENNWESKTTKCITSALNDHFLELAKDVWRKGAAEDEEAREQFEERRRAYA